jgi:hypothetical protein
MCDELIFDARAMTGCMMLFISECVAYKKMLALYARSHALLS